MKIMDNLVVRLVLAVFIAFKALDAFFPPRSRSPTA